METRPLPVTPREMALRAIDLLDDTYKLGQQVGQYTFPHSSPNKTLPGGDRKIAVALYLDANQAMINACLEQLGGVPLTITDTSSGCTFRCTGEAWQGFDPDVPGNLLWRIKGTPPEQTTSLGPSMIEELRSEYI